MRCFTLLFLAYVAPIVLSACGTTEQGEGSLESALDRFNRTVESALKEVSDLKLHEHEVAKMAETEIENLSRFEYHVAELPRSMSRVELSESLGELGKERWECFEILAEEVVYRVFCRRRPKSYLRYLQRGL